MNTYKITFTRENGTVGSDNFTAPSEAQARRDFKEVYRHGNGTITSVELVSSDAPATKRQERAALEKIRKIVDELGPDSYIATAFDGCFKDAEANIENDWALSMKDRWLTSDRELNDAAARIVEVADQPESAAFRNAVKDHRAAKADLSHWTEVLTRVNTAKGRA